MIDITKQLMPHEWIHIPADIRQKMVDIFSIPKSGSVSVVDNQIQSDGRSVEDLVAISVSKMQTFTGSTEESFRTLLELTIKKITHVEQIEQIIEDGGEDKGADTGGHKKSGRNKKVSSTS